MPAMRPSQTACGARVLAGHVMVTPASLSHDANLSRQHDVREKRYFQFFRQRTVESTNSLVGFTFWSRLVLQIVHAEPAIKHAALALGALHQYLELPDEDPTRVDHLAFTEEQHRKALTAAKMLVASATPEDLDRVLAACVLFICYEGIRGDYAASRVHMESGRSIVKNNRERLRQSSRRNDLVEIQYALARLDLSALTFQDTSAPMTLSVDEYYQIQPSTIPDMEFNTFAEAHASLTDLARLVLIADIPSSDSITGASNWNMDVYNTERAKCVILVRRWKTNFEDLLCCHLDAAPPLSINMLRMMHATTSIIIAAGEFGPDTRWDEHYDGFVEIVDLAELIVAELCQSGCQSYFSVEQGYIDGSFLVATRCRDPVVRRRAIEVLRRLPRQEGIWQSAGAAAVAQCWMEVEEEGPKAPECASDVRTRVSSARTSANVDASSVRLQLYMSTRESAHPVVREEYVQWQKKRG
ncbi:hypothetical protein LTR12_015276 [Friedmanniomyces endolithicus]|nr:hypothetical protein LTR74_015803 [Friedmanniomyces endolithicus]KAK1810356.1 hypothetical protein LTR12_015276 [Friedmanniomyces endolithicus]